MTLVLIDPSNLFMLIPFSTSKTKAAFDFKSSESYVLEANGIENLPPRILHTSERSTLGVFDARPETNDSSSIKGVSLVENEWLNFFEFGRSAHPVRRNSPDGGRVKFKTKQCGRSRMP